MSTPILTFFNNKDGVGKTSLIYHLSWIFSMMKKRVLAIDLDPQANLTAAFLDEDTIEKIWNQQNIGSTIFHCVEPLSSSGDITEPTLIKINTDLYLLPGDIELSCFEDTLSNEWLSSVSDVNNYRSMLILSSFWQVIQKSADKVQADIILVDTSSNLGAINRSVLVATDYIAIPLGTNLFSLQGLKNLGPTLNKWKHLWQKRLGNWTKNSESSQFPKIILPKGKMQTIGYLCQQHGIILNRTLKAYDKWVNQIPSVYRKFIQKENIDNSLSTSTDPYCLTTVKHYRSLVSIAQEHRKPIFNLTPADGAIGSHASAVQDAKKDFMKLARIIAKKIGIIL